MTTKRFTIRWRNRTDIPNSVLDAVHSVNRTAWRGYAAGTLMLYVISISVRRKRRRVIALHVAHRPDGWQPRLFDPLNGVSCRFAVYSTFDFGQLVPPDARMVPSPTPASNI